MTDDLKAQADACESVITLRRKLHEAADRIAELERGHQEFRLQNDREWKAKVDWQKQRAQAAEAKCDEMHRLIYEVMQAAEAFVLWDCAAERQWRDGRWMVDARTALAADQPLEQQGYKARGEPLSEQPQQGKRPADQDDGSALWAARQHGRGFHEAGPFPHPDSQEAKRRAARRGEREEEAAHTSSYDAGWNAALEKAAQAADQDAEQEDCKYNAKKRRSIPFALAHKEQRDAGRRIAKSIYRLKRDTTP